jgi:hypothetical protein
MKRIPEWLVFWIAQLAPLVPVLFGFWVLWRISEAVMP